MKHLRGRWQMAIPIKLDIIQMTAITGCQLKAWEACQAGLFHAYKVFSISGRHMSPLEALKVS